MSESKASTIKAEENGEKKPICKACCACPETKQERDKW